MAVVRKALMCEASGASRHAKILDAVIGPNTEIQEGEVTSSLVGPLVGFHHQSMLIACLWPEGRGNVGHGAALGSNHTGRRADQEMHAGEGVFFGLSCQVQFPSNLLDAPWSLVAAGTRVPAGRWRLPFSLIRSEAGSDLPRVKPGWMWLQNAYALERAESKLASRDRTRGHVCQRSVLNLDVLEAVRAARALLRDPEAAFGPGLLTDSDRKEGIAAYTECLSLSALRAVLAATSGDLLDWAGAFLAEEFPQSDPGSLLARLPGLERLWVRRVRQSRERDDQRGVEVFPDYGRVHPPAREDDVVRTASTRARDTVRLVRERLHG
jgi:hypothetical protein